MTSSPAYVSADGFALVLIAARLVHVLTTSASLAPRRQTTLTTVVARTSVGSRGDPISALTNEDLPLEVIPMTPTRYPLDCLCASFCQTIAYRLVTVREWEDMSWQR